MLLPLLVAVVIALGGTTPAHAAAPTYSQWKVGLWPEYDDQRTLVTFDEQLDQSVQLPFKFSYAQFPLDAQVGMSCQVTPSGEHQCQQRQVQVNGNVQAISYTAPSERQLYMEYYADLLDGKRPTDRKMTYSFTAPADIANLQVLVKQPKDASGFTVTPGNYSQQTDSEGFTLDVFDMQNVKKGQKYTFTFSYRRPTWTPPVAKTQNNGSQGGGAPLAGGRTGQTTASQTTQLFGLLGVAGFLGAFLMLVLRRPSQAAAPSPTSSSAKRKAPAGKSAGSTRSRSSSGSQGGKSGGTSGKAGGSSPKRKSGGARRPQAQS